MYAALVVGLAIMIGKFFDWWMFSMLSRPIFLVSIVGVLLGSPVEGVMLGASLELIFIGTTFIGGVMPQDIIIGSVFASALAIVYGQDASVAVALSVPLSLLGSVYWNFFKGGVTFVAEKFEKLIDERNLSGFRKLWIAQYATFLLSYFLIGFIGFYLGAEYINIAVEAIPEWITASMSVAAGMLPALGMALLMLTLWDRETAPYFFIGFALVAFFGGNLISIAFIGVAIATIIGFNEVKKNNKPEVSTTNGMSLDDDEEEDFFGE
ncbi:PTS mannose/fructose/sorbose/N-acetylgalactosamine transporter subunit IIC [Enterococcus sp. DIV0240d]|uniref:PTS mannose/fructose/sorbose/N-acetylgalactosamine transporter subunit IIC n=1 Tax=Enterococcus sp. DIV0240d TaxID=2774717 RepID=UPI003F26100A